MSQDVEPCDVPASSVLDRRLIDAAYFRDAYRAPLRNPDIGVVELFVAIFGFHPPWMKSLLILRNRVAAWFGLDTPPASQIANPVFKRNYRVGETIGPWPIFALTDSELVAGRDNKHLDFRLSILRANDGDRAAVVVSTICTVHNLFGKLYLLVIIPFHKWGVQRLISNAVAAGRL